MGLWCSCPGRCPCWPLRGRGHHERAAGLLAETLRLVWLVLQAQACRDRREGTVQHHDHSWAMPLASPFSHT